MTSLLLPLLTRREVQIGLALALLTIATYAPVYACAFVNYDDPIYVTENLHVQRGLTLEGIVWSFTSVEASNWHPLTWLSLQMDIDVYNTMSTISQMFTGQSTWTAATVCHQTNLILHTLNVLLLYSSLVRMTGSWPRPAFVAALFAVHPLHVESVAWITERKDVLSTFFGLLALLAYVSYARQPNWKRYLLVMLCYAASLLAKQMLVTLPFLFLLLDWWPLRRLDLGQQAAGAEPQTPFPHTTPRRLLIEKLPLLVLALAACAVTVYAQNAAESVKSLEDFPLALRLSNVADSIIAYLRQTAWPTKLAVFYPYPHDGLPMPRVIVEALLLLAITLVALCMVRTRPYLLVGWLWFLGTLAPVIGIVQIGDQSRADRYLYFPHIGLFLAVVWGLGDLLPARRPVLFGLVALLLLAPCVLLTHKQISCWENDLTLWEHARAVTEDNTVARTNYGQALKSVDREEEACAEWQAAIRINRRNDVAQASLGHYYMRHHQQQQALEHYRAALAARPGDLKYQSLANSATTEVPP
jgi:protein O-mannosyl-transferase